MNKKGILTKKNIEEVANFLKDSVESLIELDEGCCQHVFDENLSLYVGWSSGWDPDDETVIHSIDDKKYAIDAAIKIRNGFYWADFEYLDFPCYDDGEIWDNSISLKPNMDFKDYKKYAKCFLEIYVDIVNNGMMMIN